MSYQREFDRRVRLGVVGVGSHCYRNILPTLTYLPVELVALCDVDGERVARTAAQYGTTHYQSAAAMYASEELDGVILCVGARQHPPLAIEAFAAGLHVWMEKPPASRAAAVQEMIAARGERVCVVGLKKAFMPATRKVVDLIDSQGGSAAIRSILGVFPMTIPADRALELADPDASEWLDHCWHPLAAMTALGGSVEALTVIRGRRGGGACVLEFASGAIGNLHLGEGAPLTQPFEHYSVFGEEWRADIENCSRVRFQRGIPFDYEYMTSFAPPGVDHGAIVWEAQSSLGTLENKAAFVEGFHGSLGHFCDSILESRAPSLGTLESALMIAVMYEAALQTSGERVALAAV
jgi:predicted dehydrogenase